MVWSRCGRLTCSWSSPSPSFPLPLPQPVASPTPAQAWSWCQRCLDGFLGGRPPTTPGPKSPSSLKKPCSPEAPPSWQGAAGPGDTLSPSASGRSAYRASFALTEHLGRRVALAWPSCLWRPAGMSAAVIWGHLPGLWPAAFYCFSEHPGPLTWLQGQPRAGSQIHKGPCGLGSPACSHATHDQQRAPQPAAAELPCSSARPGLVFQWAVRGGPLRPPPSHSSGQLPTEAQP